jgi:hypothetical protein
MSLKVRLFQQSEYSCGSSSKQEESQQFCSKVFVIAEVANVAARRPAVIRSPLHFVLFGCQVKMHRRFLPFYSYGKLHTQTQATMGKCKSCRGDGCIKRNTRKTNEFKWISSKYEVWSTEKGKTYIDHDVLEG